MLILRGNGCNLSNESVVSYRLCFICLTGNIVAKMAASTNVKLSLQSLSENKIKEISYDGRETFIKPLTMSESLTDLANRIDFLNVDDETQDEDDDARSVYQAKQRPWEGIRTHLQRALIEMNVLVDVLSIAQNKQATSKEAEAAEAKRYLMYDFAPKEAEQPKPIIQMVTKKKCLMAAAKILLNGADRLSKAWSEASMQIGFHSELLRLRQRWRVRRVGEKIIGDLSYRTAGSDFLHSGAFEVIKKSDDDDNDEEPTSLSVLSLLPSPIKVVVSADLLGHAAISVSVIDLLSEKDDLMDNLGDACHLRYSDLVESSLSGANHPLWHRKLCNAQNVLFCRELFVCLTKEAIQYRSTGLASPFVVVGDTISTNIFTRTKLTVRLLYSKKSQNEGREDSAENLYSLKHALLQTLQNFHSKRQNVATPHPTSAVLGLHSKMRQAAVKPSSSRQLNLTFKRESTSLAESLVNMAKHFKVRKGLTKVIDSLTRQFQDPDVQAHWSMVSNMYESSVRITIANSGFESCYRTVVQLTAKPSEVKTLQRDGRVLFLSVDVESIYKYFVSLISTHQLLTLEVLSRILGWTLLHTTPHSGVGVSPDIINTGSLLIASPSGDSNVAIMCTTNIQGDIDYEVHVRYSKSSEKLSYKNEEPLSLENAKFSPLGGAWNQIDWMNVQGRHFIQKMETLLISLITNV